MVFDYVKNFEKRTSLIFSHNVQYHIMKTKKSTWMKICNTMTPFCSLVVAFEEFFNGRFLSGIGWFSAAFAWWALFKEEKVFDKSKRY